MRQVCTGLLMFLATVSQAQPTLTVDTIEAVHRWGRHEVFTFPRIQMSDRPEVAQRINRHLCIDMLEVDPDTTPDSALFQRVWGDTVSGQMQSLYSLTWEVHRPLPQLLQVDLSGEGCGAYCEGFATTYLYDLRTGEYASFDSLFTADGSRLVNDTLHALWASLLMQYVDSMERALKKNGIAPEDADHSKSAIDLYRTCLAERTELIYVGRVTVEDGALRFWISRCAPHVIQELDDLDPVSFALPMSWCADRMRPGSKEIFR